VREEPEIEFTRWVPGACVWLRTSRSNLDLPDDWREQIARRNLPSPRPEGTRLPKEGEAHKERPSEG